MLVDLDRARAFLRVDFADDNDRIEMLCEAAEQIVMAHIDRTVLPIAESIPSEGAAGYDPYAMHVTRAVEVAILQVLDGLYHDTLTPGRDGAATLPEATTAVLAHLRVWREEPCHEVR